MAKLIGAIIVILATTWTGFEISSHYRDRTKQLRQLKGALQTLDAEIMFAHKPLHEATRQIGKQVSEPLGTFFTTFSMKLMEREGTVESAWQSSLEIIWPKTALKKGEYEIMRQFGETLGKHDRYSQQRQIMLTITHLEREELDATEKQAKYEKMVKSLGFLTGLLIILLLI